MRFLRLKTDTVKAVIGLLVKQVAVGAEPSADELKLVFDNPVDQHKVGFDMALTEPRIVAGKRVVVERRWKRLLGAEESDDSLYFSGPFPLWTARLKSLLKVNL